MNVFDEVKEDLIENGWFQGCYYEPVNEDDNPFEDNGAGACLRGSMARVMGISAGHECRKFEYQILLGVIYDQFPERLHASSKNIANFNDHSDTVFDDVITVLEKASVKLEELV